MASRTAVAAFDIHDSPIRIALVGAWVECHIAKRMKTVVGADTQQLASGAFKRGVGRARVYLFDEYFYRHGGCVSGKIQTREPGVIGKVPVGKRFIFEVDGVELAVLSVIRIEIECVEALPYPASVNNL